MKPKVKSFWAAVSSKDGLGTNAGLADIDSEIVGWLEKIEAKSFTIDVAMSGDLYIATVAAFTK